MKTASSKTVRRLGAGLLVGLSAAYSGAAQPASLDAPLERLMGVPLGEHARVAPRPDTPRTGFFLAQPYDPTMAMAADAVQLYAGLESTAPAVGLGQATTTTATAASWTAQGYAAQLFLHSRYGSEVRLVPAENQTDREGRLIGVIGTFKGDQQVDLAVGPLTPELTAAMHQKHGPDVVVRAIDRYMIPTRERIELAKRFYESSLRGPISGFCFDEPEIWANAGYSDAFKAEWLAHYGTPWQPPHRSVDARYKAEKLKLFLVHRWVEEILNDVTARRPDLTRLLALHSQTNYAGMGMGAHHHSLFSIPVLNEVVAEVWNEPFDSGYLQYSSFWHQLRGTDKKLWFMMDPWGDSPALSIDFYRRNYGNNVLAALMFPGVDRYQPLIWPNRLYGKIPPEYETLINTVAGALGELWRHADGRVEAGSNGFATLVSDSMGWQRAEPAPSDFDGFLGLAGPLVHRGLPVDVLSLDRAAEPGYLDAAKCLLISFDFLKPTDAAQNEALASWVRRGGTLVCFGGTDAYNAVTDSWWAQAGHATPLEELFARLGAPITRPTVLATAGHTALLQPTDRLPGAPEVTVPLGPTPGDLQYQRRVTFFQSEEEAKESTFTYPVTIYAPPPTATVLYRLAGDGRPAVWQVAAGRGTVIFAGVSPGFMKTNATGAAWLRAIARHGLEMTGAAYQEQTRFLMRRGPYAAVHTLDEPCRLAGRYVDLFDPALAVAVDPVIPPQTNALYAVAPGAGDPPRVSGRLLAHYAGPNVTSFLVQAPAKTNGTARVWAGPRQAKTATAFTPQGAPVAVAVEAAGDTLLLRYPNAATSLVVRVDWQPASLAP